MKQSVKIFVLILIIVLIFIVVARWNSSSDDKVKLEKKKKRGNKIILKLLPPQEIQASNDNGTVTITWREPNGAKSYILYYSDSPNLTPETARSIGSITGSEFVISKVPAGKYYCFMTSLSGARESEPSPLVEFDVVICTPPGPPNNLKHRIMSIGASGGKVLISWTPESTLDGYVIRVNHDEAPFGDARDHLVTHIDDPMTANHILENLDMNFKWYVSISSVAAHCGEGDMSEAIKLN